jgi:hypothetical protein
VQDSPPIAADQPVSRQYEQEYFKYFGWPAYWHGPALWGPGPFPLLYPPVPALGDEPGTIHPSGDPHLRSVKEVSGYHLQARDGELGHVDDVVVEDSNWAIRYLVIQTRAWLGRKVLLAPQWIQEVRWQNSSVAVDLTRDCIKHAPEYDPHSAITREYEVSLFKYYSREGYWQEAPSSTGDAS